MLINTHIALANKLANRAEELGNWSGYNRLAFIWGNIRPDFHSPFIRGFHVYDRSIGWVELLWNMIEISETDGGMANSFRLGCVMHFVADYFTLAHNDKSMDGSAHFEYERRLHELFIEEDIPLSRAAAVGDLKKFLDARREEYLSGPPSMERDCRFICATTWALTERATSSARSHTAFA